MISTLISYFPSGLTLLSSSTLLLIGIGLLIYQYFSLPPLPHRTLALIIGASLLASGMYLNGAGSQKRVQEVQLLQNQLKAASEALKLSKQLSDNQIKDTKQATKDREDLELLNRKIQDAVKATPDSPCFTNDDTSRLRSFWNK